MMPSTMGGGDKQDYDSEASTPRPQIAKPKEKRIIQLAAATPNSRVLDWNQFSREFISENALDYRAFNPFGDMILSLFVRALCYV